MPITLDNFRGTAIAAATASASFALTLTTNAVLLVCVGLKGTPLSLSACTYNGVALTQLARFEENAIKSLQIFGLTAPAAGANTLKVTVVGAGLPTMTLCGLSYSNVKAINPWGTVVGGSVPTSDTVNLSFSSSSTDLVVGFFEANTTIQLNNAGATTRFSDNAAMGYIAADMPGAPSLTLSATAVGGGGLSNWLMLGVSLAFSAPPTATLRYFRAMLGAGY